LRTRWLGATGVRVPEIAVEGEGVELIADNRVRVGDEEWPALVARPPLDVDELRAAHERGTPVVVAAADEGDVAAALERPEVASVVVPPERRELLELDLRRMKYG
jgi:hypothetical protein